MSKEIEQIQAQWKTIGFASKKDNQKIYDRFRAACDKFYERKRVYFMGVKDGMEANIAKKEALIAQAEALKDSEEWKKATDQFISLQRQWKEEPFLVRSRSSSGSVSVPLVTISSQLVTLRRSRKTTITLT